ncbi:hypothetical protein TWF102_003076 [Orbilia oligospora]|uniref:Uncharacterized protein n=1 Tax=Orbilia oligospora TaxID=2813651 RepID=A0A7C8JEV2_ORBOL|nr:hypothetical protein TWF102_003076 [Orbilia oligospora]KAF3109393.1 hypothetical protein TWF103_005263 [Orbilia oligospora]
MPSRPAGGCLLRIAICTICFSAGIYGQGFENDDFSGSEGSGNLRMPTSFRSGVTNRIGDAGSTNDARLTTVRDTLSGNELNTPRNGQPYNSHALLSPGSNSFRQNDFSKQQKPTYRGSTVANSHCEGLSFLGSGRNPDTCRTRDNSGSDMQYDIDASQLTSRKGSTYGDALQPMQQIPFGKAINIPNLQLSSPGSLLSSPRIGTGTASRGYGNLNPVDTARGASKKIEQNFNMGDEDDEPALPTEPDDDDDVGISYDYTPNLDLSTPEGESFSLFQGTRSTNKPHPGKPGYKKPGTLKVQKANPYTNSVTWFKQPSEESSELTRIEPVWQGDFLQPSEAKGFILTLLNSLTDDLWVVVKGGFPYPGYNLFTQKFAEGEAARWIKVDGRLKLAGHGPRYPELVVYICKGGNPNAVLSLIEIDEARRREGKQCPENQGGGVFKSLGWSLRRSASTFVDPRIEGTLIWEGVTDTGNLLSIFPPENDKRLWWTTKRPGGGRRKVPLVAFLGLADNWNPNFEHDSTTTEIEKLTRKLPYLARYKPIETDKDGFTTRFEPGLWFEKPFLLSGTFTNTAKSSTLVPWHIYVEESPKRLPEPGKSSTDRFIVARPDGRETTLEKPVVWRAKQVRPDGLGVVQNRVYQLPIDPRGYKYTKFIYTCNGQGVFLRVGTQKEAERECEQGDWIYSNFEFFVSYFAYKTTKDAHQEGTEMVFKPGDSIQGFRALSVDKVGTRPTAARLYVVKGYNYVFDGKIILHAEIFV